VDSLYLLENRLKFVCLDGVEDVARARIAVQLDRACEAHVMSSSQLGDLIRLEAAKPRLEPARGKAISAGLRL